MKFANVVAPSAAARAAPGPTPHRPRPGLPRGPARWSRWSTMPASSSLLLEQAMQSGSFLTRSAPLEEEWPLSRDTSASSM